MLKNNNGSRVSYDHLDNQTIFIKMITSHGLSNVVNEVSFQLKKMSIYRFHSFSAIGKLKGKTNFVALSVLFQISIFVFFEFGILQIPQRSCVLRILFFIQSINITLGRDHYRC